MNAELLTRAGEYLDQGGLVMVPLVVGTFVLYYALGYRLLLLRRGLIAEAQATAAGVRAEPGPGLRLRLEAALAPYSVLLGRGATLAKTIVVVAPLLGLLGTVGGMIEMFDSLGDQTFYAQHGGIAQGIAKALFTTQLGLAIAIPGYFATRLLERRQAWLEGEVERIKTGWLPEAAEGSPA